MRIGKQSVIEMKVNRCEIYHSPASAADLSAPSNKTSYPGGVDLFPLAATHRCAGAYPLFD